MQGTWVRSLVWEGSTGHRMQGTWVPSPVWEGSTGHRMQGTWVRSPVWEGSTGHRMQGTWVRSLVREGSTGHRAPKPVRHRCCSYCSYWSPWTGACALQQEKPLQREACALQQSCPLSPLLEKARVQQRRPSGTRRKLINFKKSIRGKFAYVKND